MIDLTLKNANILIVDDQQANIDVLEGFLEMQGYTNIKTTQDPRDVVPLFASFDPDLILLDLSMPYLSGFEVMEQLKSLIQPNTYLPILVLTADVTAAAKQRALSGGASDFLTKPFDLIEVGLRIRNLLYTCFLQQQLLNQNQILEEKVKERTIELETKNTELLVAKEKAEASDRLKSAFINNISHEIRTPLNGILGFGQILSDPDLPETEKEEYLAMMNSSSSRLINTISNFMDISLLNSGNQSVLIKNVKIKPLVADICNRFRDDCSAKNLSLTLSLPEAGDELIIFTDSELLSKALTHLIDNAVKFTRTGTIEVGFRKNEEKIEFYVNDTGIGIEKENFANVFSNFWQENTSNTRGYEGSGLGLPIAKGFVDLLGGTLTFTSDKGNGSRFTLVLPASETKKQEEKTKPPVHKLSRQTILIAEDDDINFYYLSTVLKNKLIDIVRAQNGLEAIEHCHSHPEIELILMDLKMPEMDGFEATRQIKATFPDLPVVAITAYAGTEDKQKALDAGCDDFLTKPLKKEFLLRKLESYGLITEY